WITKEERRIEKFYLVRKYTIKPVNKVEIEEQKSMFLPITMHKREKCSDTPCGCQVRRYQTVWIQALSGKNKPNTDTQEPTNQHLYRSMTDQFSQAFFGKWLALKGLVDHLIEDTSLDADSTTDTGSIIHD